MTTAMSSSFKSAQPRSRVSPRGDAAGHEAGDEQEEDGLAGELTSGETPRPAHAAPMPGTSSMPGSRAAPVDQAACISVMTATSLPAQVRGHRGMTVRSLSGIGISIGIGTQVSLCRYVAQQ